MLNHFSTLLRNVPGAAVDPDVPGEELAPLDYAPVVLPSPLQTVRRVLFGATPDRAMLNYRSRQLLTVLHATELAEYVTALDPRITYDVLDRGFTDLPLGAIYQQVAGSESASVTVSGQDAPPDYSGRMQKAWLLTVVSDSLATILHDGLTTNANYTSTAYLSSLVPLPNSGLFVNFQPLVGAAWRIENLSRPVADLGSLLATLKAQPYEELQQLFLRDRPEGYEEPMLTFWNLWLQHRDFAHQLGGLLCALVYHTELLRS